MGYEDEIRRCIDQISSARYVDLKLENISGTIITLEDGTTKETSFGMEQGIGIRTLHENSWGFACTNDLSKLPLYSEKSLRAAKTSPGKKEPVCLSDTKPITDHVRIKPKINPAEVDIGDKMDLVKDVYDAASHVKNVESVTVRYMDDYTRTTFANSEGSFIKTETPSIYLGVTSVARKNGDIQEGREQIGAVAGLESIEDPRQIGFRSADKASRLLDAKRPPSGTYPLVMDPKLAGVFVHEALGHAAEADHVVAGESILRGKLGEPIASDLLTIADDPSIEHSYGYYPYDDEGVPAMRTEIIKDGTLTSYLHNRETAHKLNSASTGNARASDHSNIPIVRMSNIVIEPGDYKFRELAEDIKLGIYAKGMRGGQVDTTRGEFQFAAEEAFLVENGWLSKRLRDVSISGKTLETLKNVDAIADEKRESIGTCGKDGQLVSVSEYAPHLRVSKILVG